VTVGGSVTLMQAFLKILTLRWCIRDSTSAFFAVGTNICRHTVTVAEGEAIALLEAMRETISRGWSNVVFESGSKVVVNVVLNLLLLMK
jgi:hypothetical protein